MENFKQVRRRRRNKEHSCDFDKSKFRAKMDTIRSDLCSMEFYQEFQGKLLPLLRENIDEESKVDVVCLGLGNFVESYIARYQLALLLALRDDCEILNKQFEVYDPVFTMDEKQFLRDLDLTVPEDNMEGKLTIQPGHKTLFYLPHCGKPLYNNILWSNWGPQLSDVVIIGNSFSTMIERTPTRLLEKTANYVMKIYPYTKEMPVSVPPDYDDVFNDTSIHTFPAKMLQEVSQDLWEQKTEPVYNDDDEIIFSNKCNDKT